MRMSGRLGIRGIILVGCCSVYRPIMLASPPTEKLSVWRNACVELTEMEGHTLMPCPVAAMVGG